MTKRLAPELLNTTAATDLLSYRLEISSPLATGQRIVGGFEILQKH